MDQLNNTAQTTSNKKAKGPDKSKLKSMFKPKKKASKKTSKKASSKTHVRAKGEKKAPVKLTPERIGQIIQIVKDIIIGAILGTGTFRVFTSEFGLKWSHKHWADGSFTGGLVRVWNKIGDTLAAHDGVFLTKLLGEGDSTGFFLTFVLVLLVIVSSLVVMSRVRWLAVFYPLVCIVPTLLWGVQASVISVCLMALGLMLFLVNSALPAIKFNYRGLVYALLMAFLAFVIISVPGITKLADRTASVNDIRQNIVQDITAKYYGENPLHDGDLTIKKRKTGHGTALKVTMEDPQPMYLRGFVGDVLEDDGWTPLSGTVYYNRVNDVYWMHQNGFNALGQLGQSSELAKQGGKKNLSSTYYEKINKVKVENVNANKRYAYIPYEITIDGVADTKDWGDNFLTGGKYKKVKEYSFETHDNATDQWTDYAAKLFSNKVVPPAQAQYLENESYYNTYIYDKYTYMSPDDREIMSMAMPAAGDQTRGHVEYNKAIKSVKELISYNFTYTDRLSGFAKKSSALTNIFDTQSGYDSHLATAAVMMFRYYGIPARYVEGYLITEDDVYNGNKTVNVPRENAHAWCEIYVDGLGFVPIEVCDEFDGLMPEADFSKGIQTKQKKPNPDMSRVNETNPNIVPKDNSSKVSKKMPKKAVGVVGILAGLLILVLLALAIRKLVKFIKARVARNKLFKKGDPREAVKAIYALMEEKGLPIDDEAREIGNRATYSIHTVTESDRAVMLAKLKKFIRKKKVDLRFQKAKKRIENSKLSEEKKKKKLDALIMKQKNPKKKSAKKKKKGAKTKPVDPKKQAKKQAKKDLKAKKKKAKMKKKQPKDKYSSYERKQEKHETEN